MPSTTPHPVDAFGTCALPVNPVAGRIPEMWTEDFFELLRESTLNESHFADAIAFKEQHLPKRIYKYRADTEYARENLKSDTIWLASPDAYNDPYDCLLRFSAPNMTSAFERGLIDAFVTGLELQISAEKIKEARDSGTPVETLLKNVTDIGKTGAKPEATAEHLSVSVSRGRYDAQIIRTTHSRSDRNSVATCPIPPPFSRSQQRTS
jgi:hypothetical protein